MSTNTDNIKDKIRALLAKAASTEHEAERDTFAAKAQQLMEWRQIELHELGDDDPLGVTIGVEGQPGPSSYKTLVQSHLARLYGCTPIKRFTKGVKWELGTSFSIVTVDAIKSYIAMNYGTLNGGSPSKRKSVSESAREHAKGISVHEQVRAGGDTLRLK